MHAPLYPLPSSVIHRDAKDHFGVERETNAKKLHLFFFQGKQSANKISFAIFSFAPPSFLCVSGSLTLCVCLSIYTACIHIQTENTQWMFSTVYYWMFFFCLVSLLCLQILLFVCLYGQVCFSWIRTQKITNRWGPACFTRISFRAAHDW